MAGGRLTYALVYCLAISSSLYAGAEDQKSLENDLRKTYEHQVLSLRAPQFGKKLEFDSSGVLISHAEAGPWSTCGLLQVEKLRLLPDHVELEGKRVLLALRSADQDKHAPIPANVQVTPILTGEPVRIFVATSAVDVGHLNETMAKVFQGGQLLERVAEYWKPVTTDIKTFRMHTPHAVVGELEGNRPVYLVDPAVMQPPKALHAPDPEYTESARHKRLQGTAILLVVVNEKGFPEMLEVARVLGEGLDTQALLAVSGWRFQPR